MKTDIFSLLDEVEEYYISMLYREDEELKNELNQIREDARNIKLKIKHLMEIDTETDFSCSYLTSVYHALDDLIETI